MVPSSITAAIEKDGYVFLPSFRVDESSKSVFGRLGAIEQVAQYEQVHALTPRDRSESAKNTYSGNFGYEEFPLHTDFAHWFTPPRHLVLRCVVGADQVATRVADSRPLIRELSENALGRALACARKPVNGQRLLLHLFDKKRGLFRWDDLFLVSASPHGAALFDQISGKLTNLAVTEIVLSKPGDTLVVDNWRCLHGRSAVPRGQHDREIHRAYLSMLHK